MPIDIFYIRARCACGNLFTTNWDKDSGFGERRCARCVKADRPQRTITVVYAEKIG